MATTVSRATSLLDAWIDNGELRSRVGIRLDGLRNPAPGRRSWYVDFRDRAGTAAAEAELAKWTSQEQLHEVGSAFEPIARGMLALAKVNPTASYGVPIVEVVDEPLRHSFPVSPWIGPDAKAIVIFNTFNVVIPDPRAGFDVPNDALVFGRQSALGLKAVTLCVDPGKPEYATLSLTLPTLRKNVDASAFTVAQFTLNGDVTGREFTPFLIEDGPLRALMGVAPKASAWDISGSDRMPDYAFGPGGEHYLRTHLAELGTYFTGMAELLGDDD